MSETKQPQPDPISEQDLEQVSGGAVDSKLNIATDEGSAQVQFNPKELSVDKSVPWQRKQ